VGDGIVGVEQQRKVRDELRAAVGAARRTVELSEIRYREGLTGNLEVLDAQRELARARLDLLRAERLVLSEVVKLNRALGGGWQTP
jgi:outer membrane protein TolC